MTDRPGSAGWADDMGTELFMTELRVDDWRGAVAWYVETLGLRPLRSDEPRRFALLAAGHGRLALKGVDDPSRATRGARLVFLVVDLEAEHERLRSLGVPASPPADHPREPYREVRLTGPDGTDVTLFAWKGP